MLQFLSSALHYFSKDGTSGRIIVKLLIVLMVTEVYHGNCHVSFRSLFLLNEEIVTKLRIKTFRVYPLKLMNELNIQHSRGI